MRPPAWLTDLLLSASVRPWKRCACGAWDGHDAPEYVRSPLVRSLRLTYILRAVGAPALQRPPMPFGAPGAPGMPPAGFRPPGFPGAPPGMPPFAPPPGFSGPPPGYAAPLPGRAREYSPRPVQIPTSAVKAPAHGCVLYLSFCSLIADTKEECFAAPKRADAELREPLYGGYVDAFGPRHSRDWLGMIVVFAASW